MSMPITDDPATTEPIENRDADANKPVPNELIDAAVMLNKDCSQKRKSM
jgi:hypothetical protein